MSMSNIDIENRILFEDNHLIIIDKLVGEITQGDKTGDIPLTEHVKNYLKNKYNKTGEVYLGLPHRIDRPTSGIVLLAKTSKALERLNHMFQNKKIQKTYHALVYNRIEKQQDTLVHFVKKNEGQNKSYVVAENVAGAKKAILHYQVLKLLERYTLLEIKLETGRHHQIRCQLAHIGFPIKGDLKYGAKRSNPDKGISLLAQKIEFLHPVGHEKIEFCSRLSL